MADLTLNGKTRTLRFDVYALSELELRSGKHVGWFLNELAEGRCGPAVALWLLWAGRQHEMPKPSLDQAQADVVALLEAGGRTFDLCEPFVRTLAESELYRARPSPNAGPEVASPSTASGLGTGSAVTSRSSTEG